MPLTRDLAHNPGMCPEQESNWRPLGSQAGTQSMEPHQSKLIYYNILMDQKWSQGCQGWSEKLAIGNELS